MTDARSDQLGGIAGIGYVLLAVVAGALTGKPPAPDVGSAAIRDFFIDKHVQLMAQGWLYGLGAALMLWFAVAVRRVLRMTPAGRYLGDVYLAGTTVIAALLLATMAVQVVVAKMAQDLSPTAVRVVGADFGLVLLGMGGFIVATTAIAYAACVIPTAALPRWTGWLAIVAAVVNLAGTLGVFVADGPFSIEGPVTAWLPGLTLTLWYLGVALALSRLNRRQTRAEQAVQGFG